jgi:hypothetical protein
LYKHVKAMRVSCLFGNRLAKTVFLLLCVVIQQSLAAVLAIDYGTEWTKAALVKPGIPLQIVLTRDSKRKEQSVVAFKKQERLYGTDAYSLVVFAIFVGNVLGGAIPRGDVSFVKDVVGTDDRSRCCRKVSSRSSCA